MTDAPSAKGLFKASRPKPDRGKALFTDLEEQSPPPSDHDARRAHDFYPTGESEAILALLAADGERIRELGGTIWEPAVGEGHMARAMKECGFIPIGSDIVDRGWPNFVTLSYYEILLPLAPAIITNPPYNEISARDGHGRWLRHTLSLPDWRYCALLLGWDWPAAVINGHRELLDENPFSYCYLFRWKLDFTGQGQPPSRHAWFVWDRDFPKQDYPQFRWLEKADPRQEKLL